MEDLFGTETRIGLQFPKLGMEYKGCKILEYTHEEQKDMESGETKTWDDGKPKMQVVIKLQVPGIVEKGKYDRNTETWDLVEDDEGIRYLFCAGGLFTAARNGLKEAKLKLPPVGGELDVKFTSVGKPSKPGYNAPKKYEITFRATDPFAV
jgi:hypothetical protein